MSVPKNQVCLSIAGTVLEAAEFYTATFPDTEITQVQHAPGDYPEGEKGDVLVVAMKIMGIPAMLLNASFPHNEAFSFQVSTEDQEETDRYWDAIVGSGGQESVCGWCKDKWGVSWQITPRQLLEANFDSDPAAAQRSFKAMMTMKKIDIAAIEAARKG